MDDFEEAVEMGFLEKFLRQDHDMAETSQTIGEDELDKLMREMTDADLDTLVDHLSVDDISEAELADLGASTPPSRSGDLPSASSSTSGLFSSAAAGVGAAGAAATAAAISASPSGADADVKAESGTPTKAPAAGVTSTPTKAPAADARSTPTKAPAASDASSPTKAPGADAGSAASDAAGAKEGGLLAGVGAAVAELGQKASEAVHGVEAKLEGLAAEPASVAAAREELAEGVSPVAATRAAPPVASASRTARELVEADRAETAAAATGPLPNEPTLDELIDTTLAREALGAEKDARAGAAAEDAEGAAERARLLAETRQSEAATLDALIDRTMEQERAQHEETKAQDAENAADAAASAPPAAPAAQAE